MIPSTLLSNLAAEISLLLGLCSVIGAECIKRFKPYVSTLGYATCFIAAAAIFLRISPGIHGMFAHDTYTSFVQLVAVIMVGFIAIWGKKQSAEWFALLLSSALGMLLLAATYDFLILFLALELMSIPLYATMAMKRYSSQEAALKYLVLSSLSSAIFLYAISWIYGLTGSTHFTQISHVLPLIASDTAIMFALVGVLAAMAFKCAIFPFHIWVGDVYQGSPSALLITLVGAPKWVMFMVLIRLITGPFSVLQPQIESLFTVMSIASMMVGGLGALKQKNMKRFFAYSSVGHGGFALLGFIAGGTQGLQASTFYVLLYAITITTLVGLWYFMTNLCQISPTTCHKDAVKKLSYMTKTWAATLYVALLLSLAGIPPLPGFLAKWTLIKALISTNHTALALCGAFYSIVAVGYTVNVLRIMYMTKHDENAVMPYEEKTTSKFIILIIAAITAYLACKPQPLWNLIASAVHSITVTESSGYVYVS